MSDYAQVIMYGFEMLDSNNFDKIKSSDNDYPIDLDGSDDDERLYITDDMIKIYEIEGKPAIVVQLLELGKLGVEGYIITLDNWTELAKYEITDNGVDESWINLDDIEWKSIRTYPTKSSENVL